MKREVFVLRIGLGKTPAQRRICSVFFEGMHMGGEPFSDLANAKFSLGDEFGDEFVGRDSLQLLSGNP
jgi:hypothetical protein